MRKTFALALVCALAAAPAFAGEAKRARLVTGGTDIPRSFAATGGGEVRTELFSHKGLSVGAVSDGGAERSAFGGYAAYRVDDLKLSTSVKGDAWGNAADLTAAWTTGLGGTAALKLGYENFTGPGAFSVNPALSGLAAYEGMRPSTDLSLSLSFTRDVTPAFSYGGFAAATREQEERSLEQDFRLGAGLGYKF